MWTGGWLLLQAISGDAAAFDLAKVPRPNACGSGGAGDIVVCASRERNRLEDISRPEFEDKPARADMQIGRVKAGVRIETEELPGAFSQRVMVKLKLPF